MKSKHSDFDFTLNLNLILRQFRNQISAKWFPWHLNFFPQNNISVADNYFHHQTRELRSEVFKSKVITRCKIMSIKQIDGVERGTIMMMVKSLITWKGDLQFSLQFAELQLVIFRRISQFQNPCNDIFFSLLLTNFNFFKNTYLMQFLHGLFFQLIICVFACWTGAGAGSTGASGWTVLGLIEHALVVVLLGRGVQLITCIKLINENYWKLIIVNNFWIIDLRFHVYFSSV